MIRILVRLVGLLLSFGPSNVRAFLSSLALLATLLPAGCVKAPSAPPLCGENAACAEGSVCIVGRCRLAGSTFVGPSDGRRLVLTPDQIAVSSSRDPAGGGSRLPAVVVLGRGSSTLFLHFAVPIDEPRNVSAAVLVLEPPRDAAPTSTLPIHIAPIREAWIAEDVSYGRVPSVGVPERAGVFGGAFANTVRIDVTALVKRWAERQSHDHGIAIVADETDGYGAPFSLGLTEGRGPRLEVYVR